MAEQEQHQPQAQPEQQDAPPRRNEAGVGALLKASRLRLGEDLHDIADILRIRYVYMEAIEDGRYDALPGATYAGGFIRAYAEHLGLDAEEVVRRYKAESTAGREAADLVFPEPIPEPGIPGGAVILVGIIVAVVAYGAWYVNSSKDGFLVELISPLPERLSRLVEGPAAPKTPAAPTAEKATPPAAAPAPAESAAASAPSPAGEAPTAATPETASATPESQPAAAEPTPAASPEATPETPPEPAARTAATAPEPATTPSTTPQTAAQPETPSPAAPPTETATPPATTQTETPSPPATAQPETATPPAATPSESETAAAPVPESRETPVATARAPAPAEPVEPPIAPANVPVDMIPPPRPSTAAATPEAEPAPAAPATEPVAAAPATESAAATPATEAASASAGAATTPAPAGDGASRIVVRAKTNSWIQVRDDNAGELLVTRLLRAGDSYAVPARPGLRLSTGNAGALEILVDGEPVPAIGGDGVVRRNVLLDAEKLKAGQAVVE